MGQVNNDGPSSALAVILLALLVIGLIVATVIAVTGH